MAFFKKRKSEPPISAGPPLSDDPWDRYEALRAQRPDTLSDSARQLVAIGSLRTEVNNGGFHQYLFNSGGDLAMDALAAASSLGIEGLASLIERALGLLNGQYSADRDRRQDAMETLDNDEDFEGLDEEFYALEQSADLDAAMSLLAQRTQLPDCGR